MPPTLEEPILSVLYFVFLMQIILSHKDLLPALILMMDFESVCFIHSWFRQYYLCVPCLIIRSMIHDPSWNITRTSGTMSNIRQLCCRPPNKWFFGGWISYKFSFYVILWYYLICKVGWEERENLEINIAHQLFILVVSHISICVILVKCETKNC